MFYCRLLLFVLFSTVIKESIASSNRMAYDCAQKCANLDCYVKCLGLPNRRRPVNSPSITDQYGRGNDRISQGGLDESDIGEPPPASQSNSNSGEADEDMKLQSAQSESPLQADGVNLIECGITRRKGGLIVGGEKAATGEFPWMVSVQNDSGVRLNHFCGGSIINDRWILSAAHCFMGVNMKKIKIMAGSVKWNDAAADKYEIDKIVSHEDYDPSTFANDIALVRTATPVLMRSTPVFYTVNGVCVPQKNQTPTDKATLTGWGYLSEEGEPAGVLMKVTVDLYDTGKCDAVYTDFIGQLTPQMICYASPGKDACKGDSGGPLVQTVKRRATQIGIVSFGHGCARADTPGVYQQVAKYYEWIEKKLKDNKDN